MRHPANARRGAGGFTLIELIVVIAIIGILGSIVAMSSEKTLKSAWQAKIRQNIQAIFDAAESIFLTTGSWPDEIDEATDELREVPRDPWGNDYIYELREDGPVVISLGKDQQVGGDGDNADMVYPPERR